MSVYLDTNFFIRAVEGEGSLADICWKLLEAGNRGGVLLATSELSLAEALVGPLKARLQPVPAELAGTTNPPMSDKTRLWLNSGPVAAAYTGLLEGSDALRVSPITRSILILAAHWRAATASIKLPDAIHLATAEQVGCTHFVTGDRGLLLQAGQGKFTPVSLLEVELSGLLDEAGSPS
ncbi:MAG: type II toxin-antitoxin system VapC family toxin [Devosia sp.]